MAKYAKVYRFNDSVAIYLSDDNHHNTTVYMGPIEASMIADKIGELVADIKTHKFTQSTVKQLELEF